MLPELAQDEALVEERLFVLRRDGQPPPVQRLGALEAVGVPRRLRRQPREPEQGVRLLGTALGHRRQRPFESRQGLVVPASEGVQLAQRRHGRRVAGVGLERQGVLRRRLVVPALERRRPPQLHKGPRAAGVEGQRPLQRGGCLVEPAGVHQLPPLLHQGPHVVLLLSDPVVSDRWSCQHDEEQEEEQQDPQGRKQPIWIDGAHRAAFARLLVVMVLIEPVRSMQSATHAHIMM